MIGVLASKPPDQAAPAPRLPSEEDRLLSHEQAAVLVRSHGREVRRVIRVCDDDAILFVGRAGRLWTAWLYRLDAGITVRYEEGFSARLGSSSRVSHPFATPPGAA